MIFYLSWLDSLTPNPGYHVEIELTSVLTLDGVVGTIVLTTRGWEEKRKHWATSRLGGSQHLSRLALLLLQVAASSFFLPLENIILFFIRCKFKCLCYLEEWVCKDQFTGLISIMNGCNNLAVDPQCGRAQVLILIISAGRYEAAQDSPSRVSDILIYLICYWWKHQSGIFIPDMYMYIHK